MNSEIPHKSIESDEKPTDSPEHIREVRRKIGGKTINIISDNQTNENTEGQPDTNDGYKNVSSILKDHPIKHSTFREIVEFLHMTPERYIDAKHQYYSPEQIDQIIATYNIGKPPKGYMAFRNIADTNKIDRKILRKIAEAENITPEIFKNFKGIERAFYSPDQINHLVSKYNEQYAVPDKYLSVYKICENYHIGQRTIRKIADEERITPKNINNSIYYSPEDVDRILAKHNESKVPEGYKSMGELRGIFKRAEETIKAVADSNGIKPEERQPKRGRKQFYYSPEQIQQIAQLLPPPDYITTNSIADKLDLSFDTVAKVIKNIGIDGFKLGDSFYYSPEQVGKIKSEYDKYEIAPDGYKTSSGISHNLGCAVYLISEIIDVLKLETKTFKSLNGMICDYYSPEQIGKIEAEYDSRESRSSQTSFPENAFAYYLHKAGMDLIQNARPNWLNNPETGKNLECDIYLPNYNIGIEYDGSRWHGNPERDRKKDQIAKENNETDIIHIREDRCPKMSEDSITVECDTRKKSGLTNSLKQCFKLLNERYGLVLDVENIDASRDRSEILDFMETSINKGLKNSTGFYRNADGTITPFLAA